MIRVVIVDDQRLMRDGLKTLIGLEPDLEVVAVAGDGADAIALLEQLSGGPQGRVKPGDDDRGEQVARSVLQNSDEGPTFAVAIDVILMDIRMPIQDGITATRAIHERWPGVKVLMLTTYEDKDDVVGALAAGAVGYLLKDMPSEEIAASIRTAYAGGSVLPPGVAATFLNAVLPNLSHLSEGQSNLSPNQLPMPHAAEEPLPADSTLTDREIDVLNCLAEGLSNREIAERLFVTEGTVKNHVSSVIAKLGLRDRTQAALYAVRHGFGRYI